MSLIIWLVIGGIIGWLASIVMRRDAQQGILLNIVVGIAGSFIGGFLFSRFLAGFLSGWPLSIVSALLGAVLLLLVINLFTRGHAR
ncbi:GlsB/YeaQ/YmgE family stress response membrane protein [Pseudoxanthomonas sp. SL93]|uniref:GlsB/YeaQ/YmgE family stress response membrane protein n=1 Tax=Pseudoxanthomonas sp. SL93 TaxID=2995142 RepID=UPI00227032A5|nr:GlsB/YeaQ/YmgE family stress response membrane protein [Pseudoxanthomonas sp. SL93]WAC64979.1 GlsB/YeaQ/YmgE family stress response membrane protein [Pseudoxanthomonas sp. SL93]